MEKPFNQVIMSGTKEELRLREKELREKIKKFPKSKTWKKELTYVRKQLYGHS